MAKHRDLAQLVYAKILGRESASRIWRTVVVAGAMLASPMTAHAGGQGKPAPPSTPTTAKTDQPPANAPPAGAPAQSRPAPPPPTKAELAKQAAEVVKTLAAEMVELDKKISAGTTAVKDAQNQADRDAANAKLTSLKREKADLKAKQTAAKSEQKKADAAAKAEANANKPKPRPRTPEDIRPKGRGFILS